MMRKTQKLILMFENMRVETTLSGIDDALMPLAEKLYDETAKWQADGLGVPCRVSMVIGDVCVSAMWHGKAPVCKRHIKEILGVETEEFLAKQYY